jgi:hypothetical protein
MPTSPIIIIGSSGGGGNQTNMEFNAPYTVAVGDTAENTSAGAVELAFSGSSGAASIPLAGYSGHQFEEAGTVAVYQ